MSATAAQREAPVPDRADDRHAARQVRVFLLDDHELVRARRLRHAVFDLQPHSGGLPPTLALAGLVAEAARALGFEPDLTLHGPVDGLPQPVADELLGTAREALSNVARHAHAGAALIRVDVTPDLVRLVVEDDGSGLPEQPDSGNGIRNMAVRAARLGGTAAIGPGATAGTRLVRSVPLG